MTSQPCDKTRDSTKHDTAKFGLDLHSHYSHYSRYTFSIATIVTIDFLKIFYEFSTENLK